MKSKTKTKTKQQLPNIYINEDRKIKAGKIREFLSQKPFLGTQFYFSDLSVDYQHLMIKMSDIPHCYSVIHFSRFIKIIRITQEVNLCQEFLFLEHEQQQNHDSLEVTGIMYVYSHARVQMHDA